MEEFYRMAPCQLAPLVRRHRNTMEYAREHTEFMLGQLTAAVVNWAMRPPKEPRQPDDFMPSRWRARAARKPKRHSRKAVESKLRAIMAEVMRNSNSQP